MIRYIVSREIDPDPDFSYLTDPSRYDGCTPTEIAVYTQQDNERLDAIRRGDVWAEGVIVTAETDDGTEIARASVWGIESDSDERYFAEVADDLKAELDAHLRTLRDDLNRFLTAS